MNILLALIGLIIGWLVGEIFFSKRRIKKLDDKVGLTKDEIIELLERIAELNKFLSEDPDDYDLRANSVSACLQFLSTNTDLNYPEIVASPNGTIICQWRKGKDYNLTIEFLDDYNLSYFVFSPMSGKTIRVSGKSNIIDFRKLTNESLSIAINKVIKEVK